MNHQQIMATERKIAYVDNTGGAISADPLFHQVIMNAVHLDSTELPSELSDIVMLTYVQIDVTERRAILNWL